MTDPSLRNGSLLLACIIQKATTLLPDPRLQKIQLPMLVCRDVANLCRPMEYPQVHMLIPSMPLKPRENIHDATRMAAPVCNIKQVLHVSASMEEFLTPVHHRHEFNCVAWEFAPFASCWSI
jgi:hypothetical protein